MAVVQASAALSLEAGLTLFRERTPYETVRKRLRKRRLKTFNSRLGRIISGQAMDPRKP